MCESVRVSVLFLLLFLMMLTEVYSNISYRLKSFLKPRKRFFFLCEKACARLRLETRTRNRENLKAS